jgi:hypothetical protein
LHFSAFQTLTLRAFHGFIYAVTSEAALRSKIFPYVNYGVVGLDDCEALFQSPSLRDFLIAVYGIGQWSAQMNTSDPHMHPVLVCSSNSPMVQMKAQPNDAIASRMLRIPFLSTAMNRTGFQDVRQRIYEEGPKCVPAFLALAASITEDDIRTWEAALMPVRLHTNTHHRFAQLSTASLVCINQT